MIDELHLDMTMDELRISANLPIVLLRRGAA